MKKKLRYMGEWNGKLLTYNCESQEENGRETIYLELIPKSFLNVMSDPNSLTQKAR